MAERAIRRGPWSWSQVRVGIFLIIALLIIGFAVYQVGELFNIFARRYELVTHVSNASGLLKGAAVTLAGQRVGQISEVDFLPIDGPKGNNISLTLSIDEEVKDHIRTDSRARIRTQGLLGDRYVDISPGTLGHAILQPGDTIPSIPTVEVEDLIATAMATLEETQALVGDLRTITRSLAQGEGTIGKLLTDDRLYDRMIGATTQLQRLLVEINHADGTLGRLVRDPALYEQIHATVARIDSIGAEILHGQGTLTQLLQSDSLYLAALGVVGRADSAVAAIDRSIRLMLEGDGTAQRLLTDPALYDQLLKAVIDLQVLLNDIRANPKRYRPEVNIDIF